MSTCTSKQMFLEQISRTQEFRTAKAAEYPDDTRNEESASALVGLLEYVGELDDSNPLFSAYGAEDDSLAFSTWLNERFGRYGFDGPEDSAEFMREVICMATGAAQSPVGVAEVVSALRECSDRFDQLGALFASIALPGADFAKLAAIGESVCSDLSNYADATRETVEKDGIRP